MNAPTVATYERWIDRPVVDLEGHRIGIVADVYLDDASGYPEWLTVMTGLFGSRLSFVPISGAALHDHKVVVNFPKSMVKDSPNIDTDGTLTVEEEQRLYRHYGLRYPDEGVGSDADIDVAQAEQPRLRRHHNVDDIDLRSDAPQDARN